MKHILIATALFISTAFSQASFATGTTNPVVYKTFHNTFASATDVTWTTTDNMHKATFTFNGQVVTAYYDNNGVQLALTRNLSSDQLPVTLQADLKRQYANYWVSDLFELNDAGGLSYYITLETGESKVILKSDAAMGWSVYQKTKKA